MSSTSNTTPSEALRRSWPIVAALLVVATFFAVGEHLVEGFKLDLGSLGFPNNRYQAFLMVWFTFGAAATALMALGFSRWAAALHHRRGDGAGACYLSDRSWIVVAGVLGLAIPLVIRIAVLKGGPLADDESAYQFMAELLASGRIRIPSHPMSDHFGRAFMINDGHFFSQYTLGWPALLALGQLIGAPGLINPLCSALTAIAIFLVARRMTSPACARLAVLLYLTSPMAMACAATLLSNTSCMMALAWLVYFLQRCLDSQASARHHAGVALCFGLAFFIRPADGLGVGFPLLVGWFGVLFTRRPRRLLRPLLAFALPAVLLGSMFLLVNWVQNGSPWRLAYDHMMEYAQGVELRFSGITLQQQQWALLGFDFTNASRGLAITGIGLLRFSAAAFGWPLSLALLFFAKPRRPLGYLLWASVVFFIMVEFFWSYPGIDAFGPLHYQTLLLVVILLTVVGVQRVAERLSWLDQRPGCSPADGGLRYGVVPAAVVLAAIVIALLGYTPVRFGAMGEMAYEAAAPQRQVERLGLHNAVVFVRGPYTPVQFTRCSNSITLHWVLYRPNNDPDLQNDVIWVNQISPKEDQRLLSSYFKGRQAYLMVWLISKKTEDCVLTITPYLGTRPKI